MTPSENMAPGTTTRDIDPDEEKPFVDNWDENDFEHRKDKDE